MSKQSYTIFSLGGSIVIPHEGFNVEFLKKFRALILKYVKAGKKFIIVVGGGSTCRQYQKAAKEAANLSDQDLDWLGIYITLFNAQFVRLLFGKFAHTEVVTNPTKKVKTSKPIILAGGWKPRCSTDLDAVYLAKIYGAREVINASNVSYVYTSDPKKDKSAKPIQKMSWNKLRQIVGDKWNPGANVPFDPKATKLAQKLDLTLYFVKGTDLKQMENLLTGNNFDGTIIK